MPRFIWSVSIFPPQLSGFGERPVYVRVYEKNMTAGRGFLWVLPISFLYIIHHSSTPHFLLVQNFSEGQAGEVGRPSSKECGFDNREALDRKYLQCLCTTWALADIRWSTKTKRVWRQHLNYCTCKQVTRNWMSVYKTHIFVCLWLTVDIRAWKYKQIYETGN